jgi:hypothetical protein
MYPGTKDPRNISTINARDKILYSTYMYGFAEVLKRQEWYAFGRTPIEISQHVSHICQTADDVCLGDFSRMDGRVSNNGRTLAEMVMLRHFRPEFHEEMKASMRTQFGCKAKTANRVKYDTMWTRLSGSPETSAFNTLESAFIAYLTWRMTKYGDAFVKPDVAWQMINEKGMFGGDDSIMGDVDEKTFSNAARRFGHKATADTVQRR